jgi:hypothetical protein
MGVFSGTGTFGLVGSYTKASDLTTLQEAVNYTNSPTSYSNGSGEYQVNAFYSDTRSLAATNESFDFDLASGAGSIIDGFGTQLVFTKIKLLYVKNKSTTASQRLTLSGDFLTGVATSPLGGTAPTIVIGPGGIALLDSPIDGFAVTATTGDVLTITNTATFSYDIIILGIV